MLRKWGNLGKNWDSTNIESMINFLIKQDIVKELIQLIFDDKQACDMVRIIHF